MAEDKEAPVGSRPTVRVRGEGFVDIAPDAATMEIGIQVSRANLKKAREEAAGRATAIIAALKDTGIPARDIQTSGFAVYPQRNLETKGKPITILGYDVRNRVKVTVRDLQRLPAALDAAIVASANQVSRPEFFLQHPEAAEDEARKLAMASARRLAEVLAAAEGKRLGSLRQIVDGESRLPAPRMAFMAKAAAMDTSTPIEPGIERITASVEVVWDLT